MITIVKKSVFCICLLSVVLSSCSHNVNSGHLKEDEALNNIKPGVTTKAEVAKELGSPSSESSFGDKTWYYISTIKQNRSILSSRIVDQHTVEIVFDKNDVVSAMKEYSLADSKNVQVVKRTTPSEGQQLGFFEQIFANLGRFNKDSNTTGINHGHASAPTGYPGGGR